MRRKENTFIVQFQFQYGAIKSSQRQIIEKRHLLFQFQYGAIKSNCPSKRPKPRRKFQFQYGAIKSVKGFVFPFLQVNFSSNMVRLKAVIKSWSKSGVSFQFQYGAIKRFRDGLGRQLVELFQFQYGAIKRFARRFECRYFRPISIPIWCD